MVPVGSSVMLELVLAVHTYHMIAYPDTMSTMFLPIVSAVWTGENDSIRNTVVIRCYVFLTSGAPLLEGMGW